MTIEKDDNACLWDMLTAARAVETFVRGRFCADYLGDRMLRNVVERQIEIVGEAARHVPDALRAAHAEIPCRAIQTRRHVIAHDYGEIKHERAASGVCHDAHFRVDSSAGAARASAAG